MLLASPWQRAVEIDSRDGRLASVMVWVVHTTFSSLFLSWSEQLPYQAVMHPGSMLSMVHREKLVRDLTDMQKIT